ncbi:MAG: hypothetical protein QM647_18665 [Asticcacaulis sp.]|uniref:M61 family metallopeptidase n=1 Tax=Asticcacaulis sp. TaxID=1872648 RepID=UPI0039E717C7
MKKRAMALAGAVLMMAAGSAVAQSAPPPLDITLRPHGIEGSVDYVEVKIHIGTPNVKAGETLVHIPLTIVSRPGVPLDSQSLHAVDDSGALAVTQFDQAPTSIGTYRDFRPTRDTKGDVTLSYRAKVHEVNSGSRNGPLFDLRGQPDGVNGAGMTFLALPDTKTPYAIDIKWDLSQMPPGSKGVHSFGEGEVKLVAPVEPVNFTFYYAGKVKSYSPPSGKFTMYWTTNPPFDLNVLAQKIGTLYDYETAFFQDPGLDYRIFVRENPFHGTGGTALPKSFMFGYSSLDALEPLQQQLLIAHEMTHNWPAMDGDHGDTAWYSEGTAEFYSLLLSWRAGQLTADQFAEQMSKRMADYFGNPLHTLNNADAAEAFWNDTRAQTIPYGRGLLYLINTDVRIRTATNGKQSLDDTVLWILNSQRAEKTIGVPEWLAHVGAIIGDETARADFQEMTTGKLDRALPGALGTCFDQALAYVHPYDLGFDTTSLTTKVISHLTPGSAAEIAGLREGDTIVETSDTYYAQHAEDHHLTVKVKRGEATVAIDYIPRQAQAVETFKWIRKASVAPADCKL